MCDVRREQRGSILAPLNNSPLLFYREIIFIE